MRDSFGQISQSFTQQSCVLLPPYGHLFLFDQNPNFSKSLWTDPHCPPDKHWLRHNGHNSTSETDFSSHTNNTLVFNFTDSKLTASGKWHAVTPPVWVLPHSSDHGPDERNTEARSTPGSNGGCSSTFLSVSPWSDQLCLLLWSVYILYWHSGERFLFRIKNIIP